MSSHSVWKVKVKTPIGEQQQTLVLEVDGAALSGKMTSSLASAELRDGSAEGGNLRWTMDITSPIALRVDATAVIDGDSINGRYETPMGSSAFSGIRAE